MIVIYKIISGGQYGADQAGLKVAMDLGLKTGGMCPLGWKTKFGPRPQLAKLGLTEHPTSDNYSVRTAWNVKNSDATIRFAFDFDSAGENSTYNAIKKYDKPYFDINLDEVISGNNLYVLDIAKFFDEHHVEVLNVAGNCGKNLEEAKEIYDLVRKTLRIYIKLYNEHSKPKDYMDIEDL